ncbi:MULTISPECIES: leucine-rich repeat-containing protein kinase family protein [unclassified Pseudomonas]|uniref:leucine-rich repeat-containing protein kinase family protein n=1 Tax=unclassified Pseudomonas TaxID=196821 RepID=UPI0025EAE383|nr:MULTISPECIES: leucine-rich repeat-containing protein kinase family protein [unclassified Pseudomonas]
MHTLADLRAGKLAGSKRLDLSCGLTQFPDEIFSLSESLEVLNLSDNQLSDLPTDLHRLKHLKILFCSNNLFTRLPAALGHCDELFFVGFKACRIGDVPPESLPPRLRALVLTDNCIESLPDELGLCVHLQKLMLAGNRLQSLPASLAACHRLELVRIASNDIRQLPQWLLQMPSLAWLAFAGNPLNDIHTEEPIRQISWSRLTLHQVLGEGASGVIQQGQWLDDQGVAEKVAVKLYKGHVTSDGSPLNEMAACMAAGQHAHLIPVEGEVFGHPENARGLVMQLISPRFRVLARPPSLDSCTRDLYNATRLSRDIVLRMAAGIASACRHLHARGINHGDLYAHNILWAENGESLLGDFGAAAFYPDEETGRALERIEVRAFGILLGEMLACCDACDSEIATLRELQQACVQPQVLKRPNFAELEQALRCL